MRLLERIIKRVETEREVIPCNKRRRYFACAFYFVYNFLKCIDFHRKV